MNCPHCNASLDEKCIECPRCGRLITSNIYNEHQKFEQSRNASSIKSTRFAEACVERIYKVTSGLPSVIKILLWVFGWVLIFPVPAFILIFNKNNKKMDDTSKKAAFTVIVLCYLSLLFFGVIKLNPKSTIPNDTAKESSLIENDSSRKVKVPISYEDVKNYSAEEAYSLFKEAGFEKIELVEEYDKDPDNMETDSILEIVIEGQTAYKKGDEASYDAEIKCITHYPFVKHYMNVTIDFVSNLFFDKYDVDFFINEKKMAEMKHGEDTTINFWIKEGEYTFTFFEKGTESVKGEVNVNVIADADAKYKIICYGDHVDVETVYLDFKNELQDDEVKIDCGNSEFYAKNYQEIEKRLRDLGFTNIKEIKEYDIYFGFTERGSVDYVSIGGSREYKRGDVFKKDIEVIVAYHLPVEEETSNSESSVSPTPTTSVANEESTTDETKEVTSTPIYAEATTKVKIRKEPNTSCDVLGTLNQGEKIEVIEGEDDEWGHVKYNEQEGYIKNEFLKYNFNQQDQNLDSQEDLKNTSKKNGVDYHSSGDRETAKNGDSGIFAYKNSGNYEIYYIVNFDNGFVYYFTNGNGSDSVEVIKIQSGDLNEGLEITYHDGNDTWSYWLHFRYKRQPDHLVVVDNDYLSWNYYSTDLESAVTLMKDRRVVTY